MSTLGGNPNNYNNNNNNTFDPAQVDQFTSGMNQMKEYIENMKGYADKTEKELKTRFRKMLEDQHSMKQFHFDAFDHDSRNRKFVVNMRKHFLGDA
mmetsp:Transcript_10064/g.22110  ORF Transcript_10064/g.22110 Transcript_10064/m.22110 type:complete len:96 (-) Transcript_10064:199-486(-)